MQPSNPPLNAKEIVGPYIERLLTVIVYPLIALMMGVALLIFLWGVFQYIRHGDSDTEREKGKWQMIYGIIGLVVMVSAYAILKIAAGTFSIPVPPVI